MSVLTQIQAYHIALKHLASLEHEAGCELVLTTDGEHRENGYVFGYNSKKWIEERQISYALAGNLPLFVDAENGKVSYYQEEVN